MNKHKWILLNLLLLAIVIYELPIYAENTPTQQAFSWTSIFQILFSAKPPIKPRKGGSRPGNSVCMVSPDAPNQENNQLRVVWSTSPRFIWKGKVKKIAVREQNSQSFWNQSVEATQSITYTGKPLQPGKTYEWIVNNNTFVPFQVMETRQREQITTELKELENQFQTKEDTTEAIAFAKVDYFIKHQLWSDALQQAYSVEKPSPELAAVRQDILTQMCKP
jgi:hypothetical protein